MLLFCLCKILSSTLKPMPESAIQWPSEDQMEVFSGAIRLKEPLLQACFAFLDGTHTQVENAAEHCTQNAYYNGWLGKIIPVLCVCVCE